MRTKKETNIEKLRNKLGPVFNLPSIVISSNYRNSTKTPIEKLIYDEAKRVSKNKKEILELINKIESSLERLQKYKSAIIKDEADNRKF